MNPLEGVRIDATTKGFPGVDTPVPLGDVAAAGWTLDDLEPPILAIRRSALEHNLDVMARYCAERGVALAPHGKTTMAPQLWARQLEAGAWGITAATVKQASVMRAVGVPRILIANEITDDASIRRLVREVAGGADVLVYADSRRGVDALDGAAARAGVRLRVLIELGYDDGRTGARTVDAAVEVARAVAGSSALEVAGIAGYEGTIDHERSDGTLDRVRTFVASLADLTDVLGREGLLSERPVVTAGGTLFFDVVADVMTERLDGSDIVLRAGCYLTHDHGMYARSSPFAGTDRAFRAALEAYGSVLSRPEPTLALVGLGKRDVPSDAGMPVPLAVRADGARWGSLERRAEVLRLNDQHAYVRIDGGVALGPGDLVRMGISHPCTAFDRWRVLPVLDDADRVVDAIATFF